MFWTSAKMLTPCLDVLCTFIPFPVFIPGTPFCGESGEIRKRKRFISKAGSYWIRNSLLTPWSTARMRS
jgi:hypothetical protein